MLILPVTFDPAFDLTDFQAPDRSFPDGLYHVRVVDKNTGKCERDLTVLTAEEGRTKAIAIRDSDDRKAAILFAPDGRDLGVFVVQTAEDFVNLDS